MRNFYFSLIFSFSTFILSAQSIITFEDFNLPVDTFLNNATDTSGYQSGDAFFPNTYSPDFGGFWASGWAISTMRDDTTSGFENLLSAVTGSGFSSATYAVGQQNAVIRLNDPIAGKIVNGLYITNGTYAHNSIRDGDDFAKKFGGESGDDPDFFKVEIRKYANGELAPQTVAFYLADFRFEDNSQDYIVNDWQWVDLTSLGNVDSLQFTLSSSDLNNYGFVTPLFFCIDNLEISENISTSNKEIVLANESINVYPNPAISEISIDLKANELANEVQIFDMLGRQLLKQKINFTQNRLAISDLKKGTYILQITTESGRQISTTFLKQ